MEKPTKIMKNVFFSLAFMLIGSFAFANNGLSNQKSVISNEIENVKSKVIDIKTFSEMLKDSNFKIVKIVKIDKMIEFTDSCGNVWNVYYDSSVYTTIGAVMTAAAIIEDLTGC